MSTQREYTDSESLLEPQTDAERDAETLLSNATDNKYICQKKVKQQYISVGTVRKVPSTNNHYVNPFPVYNRDSEDKTLHNA